MSDTSDRAPTLVAATHDAPLDWEHYPADFPEAVEMLCRAKREVAALRDKTVEECARLVEEAIYLERAGVAAAIRALKGSP